MNAFIDPRVDPHPQGIRMSARTTTDPEQLIELHCLCREGRLYEIERWIQAGRPLQLAVGVHAGPGRTTSALEIALERRDHALVLLLLCNGYDPDLECDCPLDLAMRVRRWDLLDLLLEWGADPHRVDPEVVFDTYSSKLFERFRELGGELTAGHALAESLAEHTSNKPLFGFAKRHRNRDAKIQTELNIALAHHASAGNEKGVALCLWAGADPHVPVPSIRYAYGSDDEELRSSAVEEACRSGNLEILKKLGPDPARDDFDELHRTARRRAVVQYLATIALPSDSDAVIRSHLWWATVASRLETWGSLDALRCLFELGIRWEKCPKEELAWVRRWLLGTPKHTLVEAMKLLATKDYCAPEILHELARTPAMRRRMKEVGFIAPAGDEAGRFRRRRQSRPTRSREVLRKFGVEVKGKKRPSAPRPPSEQKPRRSHRTLPSSITIGSKRPDGRELRLDRAALYDRVWSEPASKLAEKWGVSGPGLAKACRRIKVPVPPRGYWQKLNAGHDVHRARLPRLPSGEAEEVVIWETT